MDIYDLVMYGLVYLTEILFAIFYASKVHQFFCNIL